MKNFIVTSLYIIGVLAIIGGISIGFSVLEQPIPGIDYLTEKDWTSFFVYVFAGLISGVMMFGFAEIVKQVCKQTDISEKTYELLRRDKKGSSNQYLLARED